MADNEAKATQLMQEAEKKLNAKGLAAMFSSSNKTDDALDCYQKAGNLFKMAKTWSKAGNAFCQAANLIVKSGSDRWNDAATAYVDAANCYKKSDINEAVACLTKAIGIYTNNGKFTQAARYHQAIAEIYESETIDLDKAIQHYEQAADFFRGEESNSSANKCLLKVAQYAAQLKNYDKAIQIYEQVALSSLSSSALKYSAKEYFFRAALCHLSVDMLNAQQAIDRYVEQFPAFQDSREYKLVKVLIEHVEEQNLEGYTDAVKDYDSITRLDQWYTTMLLSIKKQISDDSDLR